MNRKKLYLLIGIVLILIVIGVSYALWQFVILQENDNLVTSSCFSVTFEEEKNTTIHLEKAYPMTENEGLQLKPYVFRLKNVCNSASSYQVNMEIMENSDMPDQVMRVKLNQQASLFLTEEVKPMIGVRAYKIDEGSLAPEEIKEFHLRLWIDESTTLEDNALEKTFLGKISIVASYFDDNRGTLKEAIIDENENTYGEFYDYKENITNIVIEDKLNPKDTDLSWDVSVSNDGSVMSYLTLNEDNETYTLFIQGNGGVIANTNSSYLFGNFSNLKTIEGIDKLDMQYVENMDKLFINCYYLTHLDLSSFDTRNATSMYEMFYNCNSLTSLILSNFDTSNITDMSNMFFNCASLTSLDLSNFDTSNVTNMSNMFNKCSSLTDLNLSSFNTSNVANMSYMFYKCSSLTSIDLSRFNTGNVVNMSYMFYNCSGLTNLNLNSFNTSKVTIMDYMFYNCSSLTSLDLSSFDTSNVTSMYKMFRNSSGLTYLNLTSFNTSKLKSMSGMFWNCSSLTSLDLSSFDTSNVTDMSNMFYDCSSLTSLDLSNFNTSKLTIMDNTFYNCESLISLDLSSFDFDNVSYYIRFFINNNDEAKIYVKDENAKKWILDRISECPPSWNSDNIVVG